MKWIENGNRIFVHGGAATPVEWIEALTQGAAAFKDLEIVCLHTVGDAPYLQPQYALNIRLNAFFVGANARKAVNEGRGDYIPVFLSEIPLLFRRGVMPLDVAVVQVSPPDAHGYVSLGASVDIADAAVETARKKIAIVNQQAPRTFGDGQFHLSVFDEVIEIDRPLPSHPCAPPNDTEARIGQYIAELIEDGATLQMGIGAIPNAALAALANHKNLGIHTEMFSDGVVDLVEKGVINNALKRFDKDKTVASFVVGSKRVYDFINNNPSVMLFESSYVNDSAIIARHDKMVAINSALEIDLTGQVCADSLGTYHFSGIGGQMDFIRGASLSEGGKPIIALPSVTSGGQSRIAATLKNGAGVTTTRAHVHYIVTEYGAAYLYGKNLRQRARALIHIAHPDHREALEKAAWERFKEA